MNDRELLTELLALERRVRDPACPADDVHEALEQISQIMMTLRERSSDSRKFQRLPVRMVATFASEHGAPLRCDATDLSLGGLRLLDTATELGVQCLLLAIHVGERGFQLSVPCHRVWSGQRGTNDPGGVKFVSSPETRNQIFEVFDFTYLSYLQALVSSDEPRLDSRPPWGHRESSRSRPPPPGSMPPNMGAIAPPLPPLPSADSMPSQPDSVPPSRTRS